jgi:hypothetical protein
MYKEPRPMREIHEIQEKLYEGEKNLSPEDLIAKIHKEAQEAIEKCGLNLKRSHVA